MAKHKFTRREIADAIHCEVMDEFRNATVDGRTADIKLLIKLRDRLGISVADMAVARINNPAGR